LPPQLSSFRNVQEIRDTIGYDVLLLPWPRGFKGTKRRWAHLTIEVMGDARYLRRLENSNVGVAQGAVSNGLCSIDIDHSDQSQVEQFLRENPILAGSLITQGRRGANVWFRVHGRYPKSKKFRLQGKPWGEWRADGNQTIIFGTHPEGMVYRILHRAAPVSIEFAAIQFPLGLEPNPHCIEKTERIDGGSLSSLSLSIQSGGAGPEGRITWESVLAAALPSGTHQNHEKLFTLARGVLAIEKQRERELRDDEREDIFLRWFAQAAPFLRPGQSKSEYYVEFLQAIENAHTPLGEGADDAAMRLVLKNPLPPEALRFDSADMQMLLSLCRELQRIKGEDPFYLSSYKAAKFLRHETHTTAASWLKHFVRLGLLTVHEKGNSKKATRYRYLGVK
jgi:hypothetical protein